MWFLWKIIQMGMRVIITIIGALLITDVAVGSAEHSSPLVLLGLSIFLMVCTLVLDRIAFVIDYANLAYPPMYWLIDIGDRLVRIFGRNMFILAAFITFFFGFVAGEVEIIRYIIVSITLIAESIFITTLTRARLRRKEQDTTAIV